MSFLGGLTASTGTKGTTEVVGPTNNPSTPAAGGGVAQDGREFTRNGLIDRQYAGWGDFSFDQILNASVRSRPPQSRFAGGWRFNVPNKNRNADPSPTPHESKQNPVNLVPVQPQSQTALSDRRLAEAEITGDISRRAPARGGV